MPSLTVRAIWRIRWLRVKEKLLLAWMCLWIFPALLIIGVIFTIWELVDKKGSRAFWDEVYSDPYA